MKESDKTEETLEDLLAEENKRLINYGVQPVLAAFFTFLFFLFMGLLLFLSGMSWFSLFPPVLGAAVSVLLYFLLKNYLFFQMLSLDMFRVASQSRKVVLIEIGRAESARRLTGNRSKTYHRPPPHGKRGRRFRGNLRRRDEGENAKKIKRHHRKAGKREKS